MACASEEEEGKKDMEEKVKTCQRDDRDDHLSVVMKERHRRTGKAHHFYLVSGKQSTIVVLTCFGIPQWNKDETKAREREREKRRNPFHLSLS